MSGLLGEAPFEASLAEALEVALRDDASTLDELAARLVDRRIAGPSGRTWTAGLLEAELERLGSEPDWPAAIPLQLSHHAGDGGRRRFHRHELVHLAASPDELLATGLLNNWYLCARTDEVSHRPLALTRLGREIVLWRDEHGALQAIDDRCPHRGARLSLGRAIGGRITCAYHGVELDGCGRISSVPSSLSSPLCGREAVMSYPCVEYAGAVWLYFGDPLHRRPEAPVWPEELVSDEWSSFLFMTEVAVNHLVLMDNRVDPMHGSFLHSDSWTLSGGLCHSELRIEERGDGFDVFRDNQSGVNIDRTNVRYVPGSNIWISADLPYPHDVGAAGFRVSGFGTPIDRDHTLVWFYRSARVAGWRRSLWRFLYQHRLSKRHDQVVAQDQTVLETVRLDDRTREMRLQSDLGVTTMRRLAFDIAAQQFAELEASGVHA